MGSRRVGLAQTWDEPKRYFEYSFISRYNETLEIIEVSPGERELRSGGKKIPFTACPADVQAEISISMSQAGMKYFSLPWRKRWRIDIARGLWGIQNWFLNALFGEDDEGSMHTY